MISSRRPAPCPSRNPKASSAEPLEFVKNFRDSGVGDVIWVRSEFEESRSLAAGGGQIITADTAPDPRAGLGEIGARTRPTSGRHEDAVQETDEEAFLSTGDGGADSKACVRPGTPGAELAPEVQAAVDPHKDIVITKTHYSAFATGQRLVQLLRGRFVTEMYVSRSALQRLSIYATALDAGRHGYDMTLVEDCCGYRSEIRHLNAIRRLGELLGTEPA